MTSHAGQPADPPTPWEQYLAETRTAQAAYLVETAAAHREYLTGPWPDRAAYEVVERRYWMTYYAAGRDAWKRYQDAMTLPAGPSRAPDNAHLTRDAGGDVWPFDPPGHGQPSFHPYPERMS